MNQRTFLGLTHNPFMPPREGFFDGGDRKTHLDHLRHLSQWSRRILVITGPFGMGKSTLFRELSGSLEGNTKAARLSGTVVTSEREVLVGLLQGFGVGVGQEAHAKALSETVAEHVAAQEQQKRVCLAMVDDAHLLETQAIQRLVRLVSVCGLRLLLFSEASIVGELDRAAGRYELEWFEVRLTGFPPVDVREYLEWRFSQAHYRGLMPFTDEQLQKIVTRSGGNPSVIDSMTNRLLGEMESGEIRKGRGGFPLLHGVLACTLVAMVALIYLVVQGGPQPKPAPTYEDEAFIDPVHKKVVDAEPPVPGTVEGTADSLSLTQPLPSRTAVPAVENLEGEDLSEELIPAEPEVVAAPVAQPLEIPVPEIQSAPVDVNGPPVLAMPVEPIEKKVEETVRTTAPLEGELFRDAEWLLQQNPEHFTLQLLSLSTRQRAVEFIIRQNNQEEFALYRTQRDDRMLYVITYGLFSGRAGAQRAADRFSGELGRVKPWLRPMKYVQETVSATPQG